MFMQDTIFVLWKLKILEEVVEKGTWRKDINEETKVIEKSKAWELIDKPKSRLIGMT